MFLIFTNIDGSRVSVRVQKLSVSEKVTVSRSSLCRSWRLTFQTITVWLPFLCIHTSRASGTAEPTGQWFTVQTHFWVSVFSSETHHHPLWGRKLCCSSRSRSRNVELFHTEPSPHISSLASDRLKLPPSVRLHVWSAETISTQHRLNVIFLLSDVFLPCRRTDPSASETIIWQFRLRLWYRCTVQLQLRLTLLASTSPTPRSCGANMWTETHRNC